MGPFETQVETNFAEAYTGPDPGLAPLRVGSIIRVHGSLRTFDRGDNNGIEIVKESVTEAARHTLPKVGDRVMYAKSFLKIASTGSTDPIWFARGTLVKVEKLGGVPKLGTVDWDKMAGERFPPKILTSNLVKVGTNEG